MALKQRTCHSVVCDVCGTDYDDGDGARVFDTPEEAVAYARDALEDWWWTSPGDDPVVLCDERNDAHVAKAREAIAALTEPEDRDRFFRLFPEIDAADFPQPFAAAMVGQSVIGGGD